MVERILGGVLDELVPNVGNRCTLVCAATVVRYLGAREGGPGLAVRMGEITGYSPASGPPALAYLSFPGKRASLDVAIERIAREAGVGLRATTVLLPAPGRVVASLARGFPVVLNLLRAPSGTWSHSVVAYGYRAGRGGPVEVLTADPNRPAGPPVWIPAFRPWRMSVVTATFVRRSPS